MAAFQDSKMNLTNFLAELASILRAKVIDGSHEGNFFFLIFEHISEVAIFFSCLVVIPSTQFFRGNAYL